MVRLHANITLDSPGVVRTSAVQDGRVGELMTPRRALWEASATICIPTVVIWGTILYLFRTRLSPDELPVLLIFVALPFFLIPVLYKRYLQGTSSTKLRTPRYHFIFAAGSVVLGSTYVVETLLAHRRGWDLAMKLAAGVGWLLVGIDHLRRARKIMRLNRETASG